MEKKLHLGCGTTKFKDWVNIDAVVDCEPDLVHDFLNPLPFADNSVVRIYAKDLLEHFDKYSRYVVMEDWARVLRKGGKLELFVPDFKKILLLFFRTSFHNFIDTIFAENMFNSKVYLGSFGNHKWGYTKKTLKSFLKIFGFKIISLKIDNNNIYCLAQKDRHVERSELDNIQVYSYANDCGEGKRYLSLSILRKKIRNQ